MIILDSVFRAHVAFSHNFISHKFILSTQVDYYRDISGEGGFETRYQVRYFTKISRPLFSSNWWWIGSREPYRHAIRKIADAGAAACQVKNQLRL